MANQQRLASSSASFLHLHLLLASLLLALPTALTASPALVVCFSPRPPFVLYNSTTNVISGYEFDLFTLVATTLNLNFTTKVLAWDAMMSGIMLPSSDPNHCDISPSSVPLTWPISTAPGSVKFSAPTFRSGYSIATAVQWNPFNMWSFGQVFTNELWIALMLTAMLLSVITYWAERDFTTRGYGKTKYPVPVKPGMYESVYNCVGKLFNIVQDLRVTSLAGKLLSLAWGFLVLVVISMYTGVVAAVLTATTSVTAIQGLSDLQAGTHVAIAANSLTSNFTNWGFTPTGVPFDTADQQLAALNMVAAGQADAIVAESPWLQYQIARRCDLTIVDSMFKYVSNVVLFSPYMNDTLVYQYNSQLTYQRAQGMYEILQTAYIKTQNSASCVVSTYVITLHQLEGLWYILVAFVGLAFAILLLPNLSSTWEMDTAVSRSASISGFSTRGKSFVQSMFKRNKSGRSMASMDSTRAADGKAVTMDAHAPTTILSNPELSGKVHPSNDSSHMSIPSVAKI